MATWSGWQAELLHAAGAPTSSTNVHFLTEWANHATSNCGNNPIDLSRSERRSSNCHKLTSTRTAQRYISHAQAAIAFNEQLHSGSFNVLAAGFAGSLLDAANAPQSVIDEVKAWGSEAFASFLHAVTTGGGTGSGGGSGSGTARYAPNVYRSWADMQTTVNRNLPTTIHRLNYSQRRLLQTLVHRRRVR